MNWPAKSFKYSYIVLDPENNDATYGDIKSAEIWVSDKPIENSTGDIKNEAIRIPLLKFFGK